MKPILLLFLCVVAISSHSQVISVWKGNTPGHERDWGFSANWSNHTLPDEFSDVVIPVDESITSNYPILHEGNPEINSLSIWPGARLTVKGGVLCILDRDRNNFSRNQIEGAIRFYPDGEAFLTSDELAQLDHK